MNSLRIISATALIGLLAFSSCASAVIDSNAPVVKLRNSANGGCVEAGLPVNNCFGNPSAVADLITWISGTRKPTMASPLLVDIGPGTYPGFTCVNWGYTTFRGAGRDKTVFTGVKNSIGITSNNALVTTNCTELEFQHLTLSAKGFLSAAVRWIGPGNSRWVNVDLTGEGYGWYESGQEPECTDGIQGNSGKHYWFESRIAAIGTSTALSKAYKDNCGSENWFFASELVAQTSAPQGDVLALEQQGLADTHFYGSVIRVMTSVPTNAIAISTTGGDVHIHGTGIDVISTAPGSSITALAAYNGAKIHATGVGYNLKAGSDTDTVTRITNIGGHVHAPYLWEHIPASPLESVTGADMTTVNTGTSDGHPHLVIYDKSCTASKWYDAVDKACRP